jgi:hypothetical protein
LNITLNINIESININLNAQAPVEPEAVQEAVQENMQEIDATLALSNKFRLAEKIRAMVGDEAASKFLAGAM